jgi:protein arginine kinase activator
MAEFPVCTHCGFTWGEYRVRGLLGCPHCFTGFGSGLEADLLWLHRGSFREAASPAGAEESRVADLRSGNQAQWKVQLAEALRREKYEEAARLRRLIDGRDAVGSEAAGGLD